MTAGATDTVAHLDLLTGAFERDPFHEALARAVAEARRSNRPLSLLHVDVDDLEEHNQVHGRDQLDLGLSWLVVQLSEVADGRGPIGRLGGDEFAVLLQGVGAEEAAAVAEAIRKRAQRTAHASPFGDYRLTVSVGVATLRPQEAALNLLEAAESACTKAKQGGRDAVVTR